MDLFTFYWSNVVWLKQKKNSSLNELGHPLWNLVMKSVFLAVRLRFSIVSKVYMTYILPSCKLDYGWSSFLPPLKRDSSRTKRSDRLFTFTYIIIHRTWMTGLNNSTGPNKYGSPCTVIQEIHKNSYLNFWMSQMGVYCNDLDLWSEIQCGVFFGPIRDSLVRPIFRLDQLQTDLLGKKFSKMYRSVRICSFCVVCT